MPSLADLLADAGDVVRLATAPRGTGIEVRRLLVGMSTDIEAEQALILGAGTTSPDGVSAGIEFAGTRNASGLVVRSNHVEERQIRRSEQVGVALLSVRPAVEWVELIVLLNAALSRTRLDDLDRRITGADLFALADLVAEVIDAPVTIDDVHSHVVAFSGRQEEADEMRRHLILARGESNPRLSRLRRIGFFQRLAAAPGPIYYEEEGMMLRVVMAVRGGGEVLGSVWGAVRGPLTPDREKAMAHTASLIATYMLRDRLIEEVVNTPQRDLARALLQGGGAAIDASRQLGLEGQGLRVVAVRLGQPGRGTQGGLINVRDLFSLQFSALGRRAETVLLDERLYLVVPSAAQESVDRGIRSAIQRAQGLLRRPLFVGIGVHVERADQLDASRASADRVVGLLESSGKAGVADISELESEALLAEIAQRYRDDIAIERGFVRRLIDHDLAHRTSLSRTVAMYFECLGSPDRTAAALRVHRNTVTNRLHTAARVARLNFDDHHDRLSLALQLHILGNDLPDEESARQ